MGQCGVKMCGPDMRPFMSIRLVEGNNITPLESNHITHAYCEISYGKLDSNRFITSHSPHIKSKDGYVYWDYSTKFNVGSLYATQSLKMIITHYLNITSTIQPI